MDGEAPDGPDRDPDDSGWGGSHLPQRPEGLHQDAGAGARSVGALSLPAALANLCRNERDEALAYLAWLHGRATLAKGLQRSKAWKLYFEARKKLALKATSSEQAR